MKSLQYQDVREKKIVFVEPRGAKDNVFSRYMFLPLMGPIYLATMLRKQGHNVRVYNENLLGRDINAAELDADVLCITGLTSTIERGYEIAKEFRRINPNGRVIIGGIHASFMKEEAAKYADNVVIGEGESVILDLINNGSKEKFIYASQPSDLNSLPMPDFSVLKNSEKIRIMPIMTSRGCPFGCNFCAVTAMFGRKYRTREIGKVVEEFKRIKTKTAFFYDDNLCADKERAIRLSESLIKEGNSIKWTAQVRCDAARDKNLLMKMSESGCYTVYIGFESVNSKTLKAYNKSQSVEDIKKAIREFHNYGIKIHGMFILGSDEDDKSVFNATSEFSNANDIDSVQYMILTPLPGTSVFEKMESESRILHRKWSYYDAMHVVFQPKLLTPWELQQGALDCYKDFYTYTKAFNGALNVVFDKTGDLCASAFNRVKRYFSTNWDTTLIGKYIMHEWMKSNGNYLRHLRNTKYQ